MYKSLVLFLLLLGASLGSSAQSLEAGYSFRGGSEGQLPFWLWANQLGVYDQYSTSNHNFELKANQSTQLGNSDFSLEGQLQFNGLLAEENNIRFTELAGALNWRFLQIKAGAFAEDEEFQGLSASNGNLAYSRNARPHPRIRAGFNDFVPLINDWLSISGFWEEGLLNDDRYVEDTHLHHKAFYLRLGTNKTIEFTAGMEHYVMWWGTHPEYGELPGWEDYFGYVLGGAGGKNALKTDQLNVLGNSYGTYQFELRKNWKELETRLYLSHPFDDKSGMRLTNWCDNLYGLFLSFTKKNPLLKDFVIEYYHTKNQSGNYHLQPNQRGTVSGKGLDNYFNHGIYRSGVTYQQMAMSSPLFAPIRVEDGISLGFENTSFSGLHLGANGYISPQLYWKAMLTYTSNFGTKKTGGTSTYDPERKQLASLVELNWKISKLPILIGAAFAADHGSLFDDGQTTNRIGAMISLSWKI